MNATTFRINDLTSADIFRFWSKVSKGPDVECWEWLASQNGTGYGKFSIDRDKKSITLYAHRISYMLEHGDIENGFELDHLCRNRSCVNPCHLEPVTSRENKIRGESCSAINARKTHCVHGHPLSGDNLIIAKNGHRKCRACIIYWYTESNSKRTERIIAKKGFVNSHTKLNENTVIDILAMNKQGLHYTDIAKQFNVSPTTIYNVIRGISWKNINRSMYE